MIARKWFLVSVGIGFNVLGAYALSYFRIVIAPEALATFVVIALAVYGAIVATFQLTLQRSVRKPDLRITVLYGHIVVPGVAVSPDLLKLLALNRGSQTVTLVSKFYFLPGSGKAHLLGDWGSDCPLPCALTPGNSCYVWRPAKEFAGDLRNHGNRGKVKIIGAFADAVDNVYKSKPFRFDIDDWLRR